jgi:lipid II:glycine glycyltransferase (peptidoglycan interpeptide bridge formation enzyme)
LVAKNRNGTLTAGEWGSFLLRHPQAHLLQTSTWGELKARHGWRPLRLARGQAGAQVLLRQVLPGIRVAYVPRGPVGPWKEVLPELIAGSRAAGAFTLILEPDADDPEARDLAGLGFVPSARSVQPATSLRVDLQGSEEEILARMHQKTRYNIGLAGRRGVSVRRWDDPEGFAAMLRSTGDRQGFGVHTPAYYRDAFDLFQPRGEAELLLAEFDGEVLGALMVFGCGRGAWYLYGASTTARRELMATYLLQWEAMRWARRRGAAWYDLWGIPDASPEALEAGFEHRRDGLWGVYRFKRGFGGVWFQTPGAWEKPIRPALYRAYRLLGARRVG